MTANKKVVAYWKEKAIHVDSVGQVYRDYECSKCGYTTLAAQRQECPCCKAEMVGSR